MRPPAHRQRFREAPPPLPHRRRSRPLTRLGREHLDRRGDRGSDETVRAVAGMAAVAALCIPNLAARLARLPQHRLRCPPAWQDADSGCSVLELDEAASEARRDLSMPSRLERRGVALYDTNGTP